MKKYRREEDYLMDFLRGQKYVGKYKEWKKKELSKEKALEEEEMREYREAQYAKMGDDERNKYDMHLRIMNAFGVSCRSEKEWLDLSEEGFKVYQGSSSKNFVYVVYSISSDTFSEPINKVADVYKYLERKEEH